MSKWTNHGDINPRVHGAVFLKDTGDSFDIVSVDRDRRGNRNGYVFKAVTISKADLLEDESLRRYADAYQDDEAQNLVWAATAYISYYGCHANDHYTTDFHAGMRAMGIHRYV
jgi:hypothetical protein